jgi:N-terminal domain of NWD NACHT-NTPase
VATNDSEQYAAMVAGVEEIVTIVARYSQIEALYLSRPKTILKQEFEWHLLSLYKHIIRYQISATCYYRRNTMREFSYVVLRMAI